MCDTSTCKAPPKNFFNSIKGSSVVIEKSAKKSVTINVKRKIRVILKFLELVIANVV